MSPLWADIDRKEDLLMDRELTPLQAAKRDKLPYVKIVVDRRHLPEGGGQMSIEGGVTKDQADKALKLIGELME